MLSMDGPRDAAHAQVRTWRLLHVLTAVSVTGFGLPARSLSSQHSPTAPGRRPKAFRERTRGMRAPGAAGAMGISEAWWVQRRYGDGGGNVADERARIDRRWE